MVVADRMNKTLPELYATISSPHEILEWLTFYKLQAGTPREESDVSESIALNAKIRNQFMMHNANERARKARSNDRKTRKSTT